MRIMFINNSGGGFADFIEVAEGMTVEQLFKDRMPNEKASNFLIRVNRLPVTSDTILRDGDRATITPLKVEGA